MEGSIQVLAPSIIVTPEKSHLKQQIIAIKIDKPDETPIGIPKLSFLESESLTDQRMIKIDTGLDLIEKVAVRWVHMISQNYMLV